MSRWSSTCSEVNLFKKCMVCRTSLAFGSHYVAVNNLGQLLNAGFEVNKLIVKNRLRVINGKITKKSI